MRNLAFILVFLVSSPGMATDVIARPADWISHQVGFRDTRSPLPRGADRDAALEIIELPSAAPDKDVLVLVPGFFQNATSFDLLPEEGISIARYLRDRFGFKIYIVNARGLGHASGGKKISLDDFAIDDLPAAVRWVTVREGTKPILFGHSQGGIVLQASLAGLDRCGPEKNCFTSGASDLRQRDVRALVLSGANVEMTSDDPSSGLPKIGALGKSLKGILGLFDRIDVKSLVRFPPFAPLAYLKPWEFLYHRANVEKGAELALFRRTLENSWIGVIAQYVHGINKRGIVSLGSNERYSDALHSISVPVVAVAYGLDPLAEPKATYRDDFLRIGSRTKRFYLRADQGHEDFMMNASFHAGWETPISDLLALLRKLD